MPGIRLFQKKVTVASGSAGDFPSATTFYDIGDIDLLTIAVAQAGAVARTLTLLFADKDGGTLFTLSKTLNATSAQKLINVGAVNKSGSTDFLAASDDLAQAMALPHKVRVSLASAATNTDISITGRGS